MAPSQRVPRSSRTKPILEVLAQPSVKRVRRTRPKQPAEGSNAPVKSLPLELITHILEDVDSPRTLANASRACRTLQLEAERLLYRKVYVGRVPHVRSLHRALTRSSRRASFVNEFEAHDNGRMTPVILLVMEILLMLTRLEHLKLNLHTQDSWLCNWKMPHDALPRLKYVQTYHFFFVHTICAPHAITHLHLSFNEGENPALNEILRVVRHQLISFKCERASSMVRTPVWSLISDTLDCGLMPKLRYLEVEDISDVSFLPYSDVRRVQMGRITLHTVVWSALHDQFDYMFPGIVGVNYNAATSDSRLACIRPWVQKILESYSSLRRFFYVEPSEGDSGIWSTYVWLFTLSSDDRLVEEKKEARDLPVWSDI